MYIMSSSAHIKKFYVLSNLAFRQCVFFHPLIGLILTIFLENDALVKFHGCDTNDLVQNKICM